MRMRWTILLPLLLAGCAQQDKQPLTATLDPEEVRTALKAMTQKSGNRWMGEDLIDGKVERNGDVCRIGRWTFDVREKTFAFDHINNNVTPPIFFGISGVLEQNANGKTTAQITGGRRAM